MFWKKNGIHKYISMTQKIILNILYPIISSYLFIIFSLPIYRTCKNYTRSGLPKCVLQGTKDRFQYVLSVLLNFTQVWIEIIKELIPLLVKSGIIVFLIYVFTKWFVAMDRIGIRTFGRAL